jgi:tetratricopeptide (TPR) repeat protein
VKVSDFLHGFASRLENERLEDPTVELEVRLTLASSLASFNMFTDARSEVASAEKLGRKIYSSDPVALRQLLVRVGEAYRDAAAEHMTVARLKEALEVKANGNVDRVFDCNIQTQLGMLTRHQPDGSERYFRRACDLYDRLRDEEKRAVEAIPQRGLAAALNDQSRLREASEFAERAIRLATDNPRELVRSRITMGQVLRNSNDIDAAIRQLELALEQAEELRDPQILLDVWQERVWTEFFRWQYDKASFCDVAIRCKEFLDRHWKDIKIQSNGVDTLLGVVRGALLSCGAETEAAEVTQRIEILPASDRAMANNRTAQWLRRDGEIEKSIAYYKEGTSEHLDPTWNWIMLGRSYAAVRDFNRELDCLKEARSAVPDNTDDWTRLAVILVHAMALDNLGRRDEARDVFAELVESFVGQPNRLWGGSTRAYLLYALERSLKDGQEPGNLEGQLAREVQKYLNDVSPKGGDAAYSWASLGLVAERNGDHDEAVNCFMKASVARQGRFAPLHAEWITDHMVDLMIEAQRFDELEAELRREIEIRDWQTSPVNPERAYVRLRLVQFLLDQSRSLDGVDELLDEASSICDYHRSVLPDREYQKLLDLRGRYAKSQNNKVSK